VTLLTKHYVIKAERAQTKHKKWYIFGQIFKIKNHLQWFQYLFYKLFWCKLFVTRLWHNFFIS